MLKRPPLSLALFAIAVPVAVTLAMLLFGCASIESDSIAEMWAYAEAHKEYDRPDSKLMRYVDNVGAACAAVRGVPIARERGCTVLGVVNYSILAKDASAYELAHEAAHRRFGDWHKGYIYFTSREWRGMR